MNSSRIEWTESSWNPVTGCTEISLGCKNCYAKRMALRLKAMGSPNYKNGFSVTLHPHALEAPKRIKKGRTIFVNSMSDLFHKNVPFEFIQRVFNVMGKAPQHTFQVLTKRANRLKELSPKLNWHRNIWMGVSVENSEYTHRIDLLRETGALLKFLSIEPLLGHIPVIDLTDIDWVIAGGESGPGARPIEKKWVSSIQKECQCAGVPFFFKQWGGKNKKKAGRLLDGRVWNQMPEAA